MLIFDDMGDGGIDTPIDIKTRQNIFIFITIMDQ